MSIARALLLVVSALLLAVTAATAAPMRNPEREAQYAAEVRSRAEIFRAASAARDAGKLEEAERGFREVLAAYPKHGPSLWRLSSVLLAQHRRDEAIAVGRQAVVARPGPASRTNLAEALMTGASAGDPALVEVDTLLAEAQREAEDDNAKAYVAIDLVRLALIRDNTAAFREGVAVLRQSAPDEMITHYFGAMEMALGGELDAANQEIERAVARGLPAVDAQRMRDEFGITHRNKIWRWAKIGAGVLVGWLVTLFLIYTLGSLLSCGTLQAIERFGSGDPAELRSRTGSLRHAYKLTIGFAAIYYFISIPILIAVVLLVAGGLLYGLLMLGHVPVKLLLLVPLVALVSIWSMLRSLIFRRQKQEEDPGRSLPESEAPALWAELRAVAQNVGTRPVDSVYLTLGTDMAVIERGSMSERLRDRGKRSLILGVGLLSGFTRSQFRSVLAHEYGHFSNRDTAGGNTSMVVQASLMRSLMGIAQGGGAAVYNPAWLFLRGFYLLFLRVTLGASRLQEILADHFAVLAYGADAFRKGLTHVVRRSLEFSKSVDALVEEAQKSNRALASVYSPPEGGLPVSDVEAAFEEHMNDKGSAYDSHPPPAQRLAWASRLTAAPEVPPDEGPVWELFADRTALEAEMTTLANDRLRAQGVFEPVRPFQVDVEDES